MEPGYQKELPREARGNSQAFSSDSAKKALTFGLVGLVLFGSWNIFSSLPA